MEDGLVGCFEGFEGGGDGFEEEASHSEDDHGVVGGVAAGVRHYLRWVWWGGLVVRRVRGRLTSSERGEVCEPRSLGLGGCAALY